MKLSSLPLSEFAASLASDAPAPGGGAAAALEGALGAALSSMVANLTIGRKAYNDAQEFSRNCAEKSASLMRRFEDSIDRDAESFLRFSAASAMPKDTDAQRAERTAAMQDALLRCTEVPLELMELAAEALELTSSMIGKTNRSAVSDLGVSALSLKAAVQSAWLNVLINLRSIKDAALADSFRQRGEALLAHVLPLADDCYARVLPLL